jgi:hypothetical protein
MASIKKCSAGRVVRKAHKSASGKRIPAACVKKGGVRKSRRSRSRKSAKKMSAHKCAGRKVWRKAHKSASGKRIAGACVKKGGVRKSRSRRSRSKRSMRK